MDKIRNEEESARKESSGMPFVRVPRSLITGPFGQEKRLFSKFEACIDLIQMARYSDSEKKEYIGNKLIAWNKGQLAASVRYLSVKWKWSKDKVTRFLEQLVIEKIVSIDTNQGQTVITIIEEMCRTGVDEKTGQQQGQQIGQQQGQQDPIPVSVLSLIPDGNKDSQPDAHRDSNGTVTRTKQKEGRKKDVIIDGNKEIQYAFDDPEFKKVFNEWINYRKELKKPLTATTISKQTQDLQKESITDAIEILNQSMTNGWTGLQPLKARENGKSNYRIGRTREDALKDGILAAY
jgi:hypothetical protein